MSYRLIALDVDGTLLSSRKLITPLTRDSIRQAEARGVHVTLATGRAFPLAKPLALALKLRVPLVTHDGAFVASPVDRSILFVRRIPHEAAAEIVRIAAAAEVDVMLLHESFACTTRSWSWKDLFRRINRQSFLYLWHRYDIRSLSAEPLLNLVERQRISPPKVFVTGRPDRLATFRTELLHTMRGVVRVTASGPDNLEVVPAGVSKASGLAVLGESLGIRREEMIAVGDQLNDLEMVRFAGLGVAMGNAPAEVRHAADFVTRTNDEDGVAYVIRRFVLEQE